tara:strand:- start:1600 stop:1932 length:333 start_codon:yes stop_codon:yes gene_type:complete
MDTLLDQIRERRIRLGLKQNDMFLRAGISRQQYQRLESKGNPRLDTLNLVALGLQAELMLIPKEKREAVLAILNANPQKSNKDQENHPTHDTENPIADNPWQGLLNQDDE